MKQKWDMKQKRNMKPINITDLHVDVLQLIMVFVAKSSDGARSVARATSVCKGFFELAEDTEVLKTVVFDKGRVSGLGESFWEIDGLLCKCLRARNSAANDILKTYTGELLQYSKVKLRAVKAASMDLIQSIDAVKTVSTRARWRAATLANKKFKQKLHDLRMRMDKINEHMELLEIKQLYHDVWKMETNEMSERVERFTVAALRLEGK